MPRFNLRTQFRYQKSSTKRIEGCSVRLALSWHRGYHVTRPGCLLRATFTSMGYVPVLQQCPNNPHLSIYNMSSRRGVGLGAFQHHQLTSASYASHGSQLKTADAASLQTQLSVFQQLLHTFARRHADTIKSNPRFRAEFARMCNVVGVDPLAGSHVRIKAGGGKVGGGTGDGQGGSGMQSLWARMLGHDLNDFYFEVAVRIVELCRRTRGENGGLVGVKECREIVAKGRKIGSAIEVSEDDVLRAVKSLEPLGSGFRVVTIGNKMFIRSVPKELNTDQATVLEVLQLLGSVTISLLRANLSWDKARSITVLEDLLADSLVWIDTQCDEAEYWSPQDLIDENG